MLNKHAPLMNINITPDETRQISAMLNNLAEINKESADGFELAAELTGQDRYQTFFRELGAQRQQFAAELMNLVVSLGGKPSPKLDLASLFQHVWMGIKNIVKGDEATLMEACENGEATLLETYESALDRENLPEPIRERLKMQMSHIRITQEKLQNLAAVLA